MKKILSGLMHVAIVACLGAVPAHAGNGGSQKASAEVGSAVVGSGLVASGLVVGVAATPVLLLGAAGDAVIDDMSQTKNAPLPLGDEVVAGPAPDQELAR